jgi:hypothetical protein
VHPTEDVRRTRVGDRVVVRGHHVGEPARYGEVLEVVGEYGAAPYLVRWELDGHVSRFYPSSDAHIEHVGPPQSPGGESPAGG